MGSHQAATATVEAGGPDLQTRATYRMLLARGLAPTEAANLTAYLCGIAVGGTHWSIGEVNRVLFLRRLARTGRWGCGGAASSPALRPAA